jgi:CubicO group peptidase (beta-lactamase class C family)
MVVESHNSGSTAGPMWYHVGFVTGWNIQWGPSIQYDNGFNPSVAIQPCLAQVYPNCSGLMVVDVHNAGNIPGPMWYRVGHWLGGYSINWINSSQYDQGWNPKIAVSGNYALEVHNAGSAPGAIWYHQGTLGPSTLDMGPSYSYDTGWNPAVALDRADGSSVEVHNASNMAGPMWYHSGRLNYDSSKFNFQAFADNLERNLSGNSVGYSFSISYLDQWNNMRAGGLARIPEDSFYQMNPEATFSTASMSKTITATAALKLLAPAGMLDNTIGPYLPIEFNADYSFGSITFRQLLQHRSGIGNYSDAQDVDYTSIRNYVSGHPNVSDKDYRYSNTNYALFRFLIPKLAGMFLQGGDPGLAYANAYIEYVRQNVFTPAGLGTVYAGDADGLNYHFPVPAQPYHGMNLGDLTPKIASQGWVLSTQSLAHFLRELHFSENIISAPVANQMKDGCMGYDTCGLPVADGSPYLVWAKGGFYPGCWPGNTGEFSGQLVVFSNGVSVALIVNSNLAYKSTPDVCGWQDNNPLWAVVDAFNSATIN